MIRYFQGELDLIFDPYRNWGIHGYDPCQNNDGRCYHSAFFCYINDMTENALITVFVELDEYLYLKEPITKLPVKFVIPLFDNQALIDDYLQKHTTFNIVNLQQELIGMIRQTTNRQQHGYFGKEI
ncbi:hypothetical protein [Acinetobacter sp. c3-l95]|uniref:hypothetical protein n=1 Tax=Acinetobacter sp. c3-l95 TaxID=3342804 RepID=UPI0035BACEA4